MSANSPTGTPAVAYQKRPSAGRWIASPTNREHSVISDYRFSCIKVQDTIRRQVEKVAPYLYSDDHRSGLIHIVEDYRHAVSERWASGMEGFSYAGRRRPSCDIGLDKLIRPITFIGLPMLIERLVDGPKGNSTRRIASINLCCMVKGKLN